jgi:hypothetical protein
MAQLIISNQLTEETAEGEAALPADYLAMLGMVAHRMIWLAEPGDVVVLPTAPDPAFASYVWEMRGFTEQKPRIVVPPDGQQGSDLLYSDRLANDDLRTELLAACGQLTGVTAFFVDDDVAGLASVLGLSESISAFEFLTGGGSDLVNSKSFFRTVCLGNGVATPAGAAITQQEAAEGRIWSMLADGHSVIVKQDAHGGGYGNEVLTRKPELNALGAAATIQIEDRPQLAEHLARSWQRYTYGGTRAVVVEHYLLDCVPIYIELAIEAGGVRTVGYGEMRMKPVNNGLIVPPPSSGLPAFNGFLASAQRLGFVYQAIGYRGRVSLDAIVTPDGRILFNELNGRVGGSTHIHHIGERVIGGDYLHDRVLLARNRCAWDSVTATVRILAESGLRYDPATRSGILLTGDDGQLLMVAADLAAATELEAAAADVLGLEAY